MGWRLTAIWPPLGNEAAGDTLRVSVGQLGVAVLENPAPESQPHVERWLCLLPALSGAVTSRL